MRRQRGKVAVRGDSDGGLPKLRCCDRPKRRQRPALGARVWRREVKHYDRQHYATRPLCVCVWLDDGLVVIMKRKKRGGLMVVGWGEKRVGRLEGALSRQDFFITKQQRNHSLIPSATFISSFALIRWLSLSFVYSFLTLACAHSRICRPAHSKATFQRHARAHIHTLNPYRQYYYCYMTI